MNSPQLFSVPADTNTAPTPAPGQGLITMTTELQELATAVAGQNVAGKYLTFILGGETVARVAAAFVYIR